MKKWREREKEGGRGRERELVRLGLATINGHGRQSENKTRETFGSRRLGDCNLHHVQNAGNSTMMESKVSSSAPVAYSCADKRTATYP